MANAKVQGADGGGLQGKISFSVVIPVFNVEPYLGQCLDSMLPALRAEDEIILALRSSEDGSITIAEHYAQENGNTGGRGGWKGDVPVFAYNLDKIHAAGWSTSMTSDEAVAKTVEAVL